MAKITKEAKAVHSVVADALRIAADLLDQEDDKRGRLLREMIPGFACKPGQGNHWRLRVRKFHAGLVTRCLGEVVDRALSAVHQDLLEALGDKRDDAYFAVMRLTGNTSKRKEAFLFECDLLTNTYQSQPLREMFVDLGPQKSIQFLNKIVHARVREAAMETLGFDIELLASRDREQAKQYGMRYVLNSTWKLSVPKQALIQHLGFADEAPES